MPRNVEIKARVASREGLSQALEGFAGAPEAVLEQVDTYFAANRGRLKLRELADDRAELIHYERPNEISPVESQYVRVPVVEPDALKAALAAALGVEGVVRKRRTLYRVDRTRIHLDEVDELGCFLELEVVLADEQSREAGVAIALELLRQLGIQADDLVGVSYIDLLATVHRP